MREDAPLRAAKCVGTSPHGFILEAQRRSEFHALADERHAEILRTGKTVPWQEMSAYFLALVAGKPAKRPVVRKLKF